jgi:hypothetical protein
MSILAWLATKITGEAIKAGGEVAKTATEIPKNLVETQKAHLEVEELKFQKAERQHLITPATFDDVKEYDPKVKRIEQWTLNHDYLSPPSIRYFGRFPLGQFLAVCFSVIVIIAVLIWLLFGH